MKRTLRSLSLTMVLLVMGTIILSGVSKGILPDFRAENPSQNFSDHKDGFPFSNSDPMFAIADDESVTYQYENLTVNINGSKFKPGDIVQVNTIGNRKALNGTINYRLQSPIGEEVLDFSSYDFPAFQDPTFDDPLVLDWNKSDDLDSMVITQEKVLNLTEKADANLVNPEIFLNRSLHLPASEYKLSFDYLAMGRNLLSNPGFEANDSSNWGNPSDVEIGSDETLVYKGQYYAEVDADSGSPFLEQSIIVPEGVDIIFSGYGTGNSDASNWQLRLEASNSTGYPLDFQFSPTSIGGTIGPKGYTFLSFRWTTPPNTTRVKLDVTGFNSSGINPRYTGRIDELSVRFVPSPLVLSYYNNEWENITIDDQLDKPVWKSASEDITLSGDEPSNKTISLFLLDTSNSTSQNTSIWLLDNFQLLIIGDPIEIHNLPETGALSSTWKHQNVSQEVVTQYAVLAKSLDRVTANFTIQMPNQLLYPGSWIFEIVVERHTIEEVKLPKITYNASFTIDDDFLFTPEQTWIVRGYENQTDSETNTSRLVDLFENETSTVTFSPGDNITWIGKIASNSTPSSFFRGNYLKINEGFGNFYWNNTLGEDIYWGDETYPSSFFTFDPSTPDVGHGNFSSPINNSLYFGLNFIIPQSNIFGEVNSTLYLALYTNNSRPADQNGKAVGILGHPLKIELGKFAVKYVMNVTQGHFPASRSYLPSELIGGNFTVALLNYNTTLESIYSDRNITSSLNINMNEIHIEVMLDADLGTEGSDQDFSMHLRNKTYIWLGRLDPNLRTGKNYTITVIWRDAEAANDSSQAIMVFPGDPVLEIKLVGTPMVIPGDISLRMPAEEILTTNFTVSISSEEKTISLWGLFLYGALDNVTSPGSNKLSITERQGVYFISLSKINFDSSDLYEGMHTIDIYKFVTGEWIGSISFKVEDVDTTTGQTDGEPGPPVFVAPLGVAVALGVLGVFGLVTYRIITPKKPM